MANKKIVIIGGGTHNFVGSHFALSAPAYGQTAKILYDKCVKTIPEMDSELTLTREAGGWPNLETNDDLERFVQELVEDKLVKVVIFSASVCDWKIANAQGKHGERLTTRGYNENNPLTLSLVPANKIIDKIRKVRKDIFLVGFKHTSGDSSDSQYLKALKLCKDASCNLVFANDAETKLNMIITPEEARYHESKDRDAALDGLVEMIKLRSNLTFTKSTVIAGSPIPWDSEEVPSSLKTVVDYCIAKGAYKPFQGSTVGHFAVKLDDTTFLTSQRKTNFNDLSKIGLVKIKTDGPDTVLAYGAKPSVGGQSQRIVFKDHPGYDCIVHFHCPIKAGSQVPVKTQYEFECGSHACGQNTSDGLKPLGSLKAVYLEEHGPNIIFNRNIDPQEVIDFINANFDLSQKTGGHVDVTKLNMSNDIEWLKVKAESEDNCCISVQPTEIQFNYSQELDAFVPNPTGEEIGDITGNRVFISGRGPETRFRVEIDDFGNVLDALNRLIVQYIPTFLFPR